MRSCLGYDQHRPPFAGDDFTAWWASVLCAIPHAVHKGTSLMILLTAWWIWKHHNAVVFDNTRPSVASLLDMIKAEAHEWAEAGACGVRQLLP
jgi:hypothetical protein